MPSKGAEHIAGGIETLPEMIERYLVGFDDTNRAAQAPALPNHAIWTLGHLALYHHRAADRISGLTDFGPLPETDFVMGDAASGDSSRFDSESVCFASTVSPDAALFPTLARGVEIHRSAVARLCDTVRTVGDELFTRQVRWGAVGTTTPASALAMRMVFHVGTHTGQIADLRRALGFPRIMG